MKTDPHSLILYVEQEVRKLFPARYHHNQMESFINIAERELCKSNEKAFLLAFSKQTYMKPEHKFFKIARLMNSSSTLLSSYFVSTQNQFEYDESLFTAMQDYLSLVGKYASGDCFAQARTALCFYLKSDIRPITFCAIENKHGFLVIGDYKNHPESSFIHDPHSKEFYPFNEIYSGGHQISRFLNPKETFASLFELKEKLPEKFKQHALVIPEITVEEKKEEKFEEKNRKYWEELCTYHYKSGLKAYNNKEYQTAITEFEKHLILQGNLYGDDYKNGALPNVYFSLGTAFLGEKKLLQARDCYVFGRTLHVQRNLFMTESFSVDNQKEMIKIGYYEALAQKKLGNNIAAIERLEDILLYAKNSKMTVKDVPVITQAEKMLQELNQQNSCTKK